MRLPGASRRVCKKIALLMKMMCVLMLVCSLHVCGAVHSQTKVTLHLEKVSLTRLFSEIERKTEFRFLFDEGLLPADKTVSVNVKNESVANVLGGLLPGVGLSYTQTPGNLIVIVDNRAAAEAAVEVKGKVVAADGSALAGVTVTEKGTSNAVTTNSNGFFSIHVSGPQAVLEISYVGYKTQQLALDGRTALIVTLDPLTTQMNEVVVVGYGTQNKRSVTGAVSNVKATDLDHVNAVSVDNLIQGKAAGVQIIATTAQPGGAVNINIRGALSPNGDNRPLYVIDGLPITNNSSIDGESRSVGYTGHIDRSPLTSINPNDIESIDILKDASATAIYGSAAANGVILITTKRGKEGRASVGYSGSYSVQSAKDFISPLNATEFKKYSDLFANEKYLRDKNLPPYGTTDPSTVPAFTNKFTADQVAQAGVGINHLHDIMRQGRIQDHNLSLSAGSAGTRIFASLNYFDQQALLKNSEFARYSGRINLDQRISNRVNLSLGISYSQVNNDNVNTGEAENDPNANIINLATQFAPDLPLIDPATGLPQLSYNAQPPNPLSFLMVTNKNFQKRLLANSNLSVNILPGLKANFTLGVDNNSNDRQLYIPIKAKISQIPTGFAQRAFTKLNNYSAEAYLNYDRGFGKSKLSAVAGVGYYNSTQNLFSLTAKGFSTDLFGIDNIGIASDKLGSSVASDKSERNKLSQFTRVNYTYNDRYILQVTGRFDGTNNFPVKNQFAFFPSVSAGWIISQEDFMANVRSISQLKLRAGYGTTGNESITASARNYGNTLFALSTNYTSTLGGQTYSAGFFQLQIGNPDLKWETDETINIGADIAFAHDRISASLDYFRRTAKDLLDFRLLPSANSIGQQAFNIGSTRSEGVELTVRSQNIATKNFSWSSLLTFGTAKTFWVERNNTITLAPYIGVHDPINAVYGWKSDGLIRSAADKPAYQANALFGNVKYLDLTKDGALDIKDVTYLGNRDPKASFGFTNTFRYRAFDLNIFLYGNFGNFTTDGYMQYIDGVRLGQYSNVDRHTLEMVTTFNPNGIYPGIATDVASNASNPTRTSDFRTVKNSYFVRLKNATIGYNLPVGSNSPKAVFRSLRVFVDFQNLGYITNVRGIDPEMEKYQYPYPTPFTTAFGISAQF